MSTLQEKTARLCSPKVKPARLVPLVSVATWAETFASGHNLDSFGLRTHKDHTPAGIGVLFGKTDGPAR